MSEVVYCNDNRYPGPEVHPIPDFIGGTPSQAELDAQPRLFTWGELKEIISSGHLQNLSRNKEIQARYMNWIAEQKEIWGSTENYLVNARLPWGHNTQRPFEPTYDQHNAFNHPEVDLTQSTRPKKKPTPVGTGSAAYAAHALGRDSAPPSPSLGPSSTPAKGCSHEATAASSPPGSGASTPASVAYVPLDSVLPRVNRALARRKERESKRRNTLSDETPAASDSSLPDTDKDDIEDPDDPAHDVFLRWNGHLDPEKYAVLPNDWPYCVPYGVRHYCVWSRVPIAHPVLVDYDRTAWEQVEANGLGGFTGVVPVLKDGDAESGEEDELDSDELVIDKPEVPIVPGIPGQPKAPTPPPLVAEGKGRSGPSEAGKGGWYAIDVQYAGNEMRRWAGTNFESRGGTEVGKMIRGLWDERGWETIWFVNPAHLQSVPGFSHFHVFARRKTPPEIDITESVYAKWEELARRKADKAKVTVKMNGLKLDDGPVATSEDGPAEGEVAVPNGSV